METDEGDDVDLESDNTEKNDKPVSFMETDEGDDVELENDNMEKIYKPVSLKFWYSVLNNVIFTEAKAHNCYCATCLTAKQLFPEYFRLFMQDCRALYSRKEICRCILDIDCWSKFTKAKLNIKCSRAGSLINVLPAK